MGSPLHNAAASVVEYFAYLETIDGKAEYFNGKITDMAGSEPEHSRITANCTGILFNSLLDGHCSVFSSDLHIGVDLANAYFFPDLSVVCGPLEHSRTNKRVIRNPTVIIEVLSPSTHENDRTAKLIHCMQIPSLREYLLIEQAKPQVDVCFVNEGGVWDFERIEGMDGSVQLRSLGVSIPMALLYRGVVFRSNPGM